MKRVAITLAASAAAAILSMPAAAQVLGSDEAACRPGGGPAILAQVVGLKDRQGRIKLELYPANDEDFLKDDDVLVAQGKTFRRVWTGIPASGPVAVCIRVPRPGRYALLVTHDRDGKNKFNFFKDGAGFPGSGKLGMSRPKLPQAIVEVGEGTAERVIRLQYLRGIMSGFAPLKDN